MNNLIFAGCVGCILAFAAAGRGIASQKSTDDSVLRIVVHHDGRHETVEAASEKFRNIVHTMEAALASCRPEAMLQLALTNTDIADLREKQWSVELIYASRRSIAIGQPPEGRSIAIDRFLVPLTGSFARSATIVFYGIGDIAGGPYATDAAYRERLKDLTR